MIVEYEDDSDFEGAKATSFVFFQLNKRFLHNLDVIIIGIHYYFIL